MSSSRFLFLYPSLFKSIGVVEIGPIYTSVRQRPARTLYGKTYTTTGRWRDEDVRTQRYGTANEPLPPFLREGRDTKPDRPGRMQDGETVTEKETAPRDLPPTENTQKSNEKKAETASKDEQTNKLDPLSTVATSADPPPPQLKRPVASATDTVLSMPAPSEEHEGDKPPHLQAPPYVHHFDTWTLVRSLQSGGFTQDQSTTAMKAVRTILADNMDLARRGLVSKSNVENETYLFKAACSELKSEVQNNRNREADKERTRRAQLQHEVDILNQRTTQESGNLKDELKGMFDDRKMAVRMEQRNMERKIQELNYKITVTLNSDARTEVESVRWVLTRRAASALAVGVVMILATLNYSRYMTATQAKERKKFEEEMKGHPPALPSISTQSVGTSTDGLTSSEALLASDGVS